jgi:putative phosphoesterase
MAVPTRIVAVSDTHVPQRARLLPDEVWTAVDEADVVVHAGDWNGLPLLDEFERRSSRLIAVRGNNDGPEFDDRLPLVARETLDGVRLAVVHETGASTGRERRLDAEYVESDLVVFGHSHIPWDTVTPGGRRLLNPGSPTDRRRQPTGTFLTLVLDSGRVRDVELRRLPVR